MTQQIEIRFVFGSGGQLDLRPTVVEGSFYPGWYIDTSRSTRLLSAIARTGESGGGCGR
jgi:hypothetical protein